jgi:ribosome-binding protein aMBF1 (putative translation factor)
MTVQQLVLDGREYVVVRKTDWQRIAGARGDAAELPPLPPVNERGNRDAIAYARASIAREIIRDRKERGLSQEQLAKLAGVRQETISRIETCKVSPTRRIIEKIEAALK